MGKRATIVIRDQADKHRFRCPTPFGHADWRVWNGKFGCEGCRRLRESGVPVETTYDELVDEREGRRVTRDELQIEHPGLKHSQ